MEIAIVAGAIAALAVLVWKLVVDHSAPDRATFGGTGLAVVAAYFGAHAWLNRQEPTFDSQVDTYLSLIEDRSYRRATQERQELLGPGVHAVDLRLRAASREADSTTEHLAAAFLHSRHLRTVIVGPAGAGKTVAANRLLIDLIERRRADNPHGNRLLRMVPVRVSLSQWSSGYSSVAFWVADQVAQNLRVSPPVARQLMERGRILPILDGLDELDGDGTAAHALALSRQLNEWVDGATLYPLVVTCREDTWSVLKESGRSPLNRTIEYATLPLVRTEIVRFLTESPQRNAHVDDLRMTLQSGRSQDLGEMLASPWRLSLAIAACAAGRLSTADLIRLAATDGTPDQLLREYVDLQLARASAAAKRHLPWRSMSPHSTKRHLGTFAAYLDENRKNSELVRVGGRSLSSRDLILHELWPIAGHRKPRFVDLALALLISAPGLVWLGDFLGDRGWIGVVVFSLFSAIYLSLLVRTTLKAWVAPVRIDLKRLLRPSVASLQLVLALGFGLAAYRLFGVAVGCLVAATIWMAAGFTVGFGQTLADQHQITAASSPDLPLRLERRISALAAGVALPALCLAFSHSWGWAAGVPIAVTYATLAGLTVASAPWRRYLSMILAGLRLLPFRPGRFLRRAHETQLLRIAGVAYQFRHEELAEYFVRLGGPVAADD